MHAVYSHITLYCLISKQKKVEEEIWGRSDGGRYGGVVFLSLEGCLWILFGAFGFALIFTSQSVLAKQSSNERRKYFRTVFLGA